MAPDPFDQLAEQLAVMDAFERGRIVHWADPLFRGLAMERKVLTSLVAEAAAHRRGAGGGQKNRGVLLIDLSACGGSIGVVDVVRQTIPRAGEIAYCGFGVPLRGSRGLIERGLAELVRRSPGPPVRCTFYSGSLFDLVRMEQAWTEVVGHYDWVLAVGLEGRAGRSGSEPLQPGALARLCVVDSAVVSFLDAAELASALPHLALLASSIDQPLEISFEVLRCGETVTLGAVEVVPGVDQEEARLGLGEMLEASSRLPHRARLRPRGSLLAAGEVLEYLSTGFVQDHLLAALHVEKVVPCGAVRAYVIGE